MALLQNAEIAQRLHEVAQLLEEQGANLYRIRAYHHAAETLRTLPRPVAQIFHAEGLEGLRKLPGVGESIARSVRELIVTGRLPMLERLRGEADPVALLASVPGVGESLAKRLHEDLEIDTLEELEIAAHDGRLAEIEGVGQKKLAGIIDSLAGRLGRIRERKKMAPGVDGEPSIKELLEVDGEYRQKAMASQLRKIAPRRFNPDRVAWLPVLHTQRGDHHYTAIFSNTARAHQMGKTQDWVVLYYDREHGEGQCTVITSERGALKGERIVRGREDECAVYYRKQQQPNVREA